MGCESSRCASNLKLTQTKIHPCAAMYDKIHAWLVRLSQSSTTHNIMLALFRSWGFDGSDAKNNYVNSAAYQWGTGKILAMGGPSPRSVSDIDIFESVDLADYAGMDPPSRMGQDAIPRIGTGYFKKELQLKFASRAR